jgi:hypothetical protein
VYQIENRDLVSATLFAQNLIPGSDRVYTKRDAFDIHIMALLASLETPVAPVTVLLFCDPKQHQRRTTKHDHVFVRPGHGLAVP